MLWIGYEERFFLGASQNGLFFTTVNVDIFTQLNFQALILFKLQVYQSVLYRVVTVLVVFPRSPQGGGLVLVAI